ncbi:MAG: serine/threonine protein kinase [Fuerstiella sp.]|nr:serine/threonine protein kinase [Fuerstiella sp.]
MTRNGQSGRDSLEQLCQQILEDQWKKVGTSEFPSAEDIFGRFPELRQVPDRQVDIVYNEFLIRKEEGAAEQLSSPETYLTRFPEIAGELQNQFQLHACLEEELGDSNDQKSPLSSWSSIHNGLPRSLQGATIEQRYEIIEKIGQGGAADVYRATDLRLKRDVAFKISRSPFDPDSRPFRRFMREAESAARLSHPGIVQVYEFGESHGRPFIVGQLIHGGTMVARVHVATEDPATATDWMVQLCDSVDYAHQCGVVHRDLKPANVLFDNNDRPLITDFGLASLLEKDSTLTEHGDMMGTPAYMSPEQAAGINDTGPATDVYSLGVILYQLLTGSLPFSGSATAVLNQIVNRQPAEPRQLNRTIPADLQTICLKAMSKTASDRYPSAHVLAEDLRRFSRNEHILARPVGSAEKLARLARRHPGASTMALLLTVVSGFAFGGALQYLNVVSQRNRATEAEAMTLKLLAQDAAAAGQLAQQQGHTKIAVERFQDAIDRGFTDTAPLHLRMAACEIVNGNLGAATTQLHAAQQNIMQGSHNANVGLLKAQLALLGVEEYGAPATLLQVVEIEHLAEADRYFLSGLRAEGSLPALEHFRKAIQLDSYHHGARRMASILALSLADFDLAIDLAEASLQLFPDDVDFALVEALALAVKGQKDDAIRCVEQTNLSAGERQKWMALADFVVGVCHDLNSGGERVFYGALSVDGAELSFEKLVSLLAQFRSEFLPLLRSRRRTLPPNTEQAFFDFLKVQQNITSADGLLNVLSGLGADSADSKLLKTGLAIVAAHPEATLSTVIARKLLDLGLADVDDRLKIQFFYENAITSKGFIRDVQQHARVGAFAVAIYLDRVDHHEPEKNRKRAFELLEAIEPDTVTELNTARILTLVPLTEERWGLSARFVSRWIQLARNQDSDEKLVDALWHHALILRSRGQWYKVLQVCDEIQQLAPDAVTRRSPVDPEGLRGQASAVLTDALGVTAQGFSWSWLFEPAVEHKNWKLADIALRQLQQTKGFAAIERVRLDMYRELLDAAKAEDAVEVVRILDQMNDRCGSISTTLTRLRQKMLGASEQPRPPSE